MFTVYKIKLIPGIYHVVHTPHISYSNDTVLVMFLIISGYKAANC
jgi:hypothetical protein